MAGAGRIRAREDLPVQRALGQLLEREIQQREVVLGVVRAGVPGPEDPGQDLPPAGHDQRVEPEPALVMPGRLLLLGVHIDRGRVEVEDHPLGAAPTAHARARAAALAARIPASSRSPTDSTTRRAVETDATSPNSDA